MYVFYLKMNVLALPAFSVLVWQQYDCNGQRSELLISLFFIKKLLLLKAHCFLLLCQQLQFIFEKYLCSLFYITAFFLYITMNISQ